MKTIYTENLSLRGNMKTIYTENLSLPLGYDIDKAVQELANKIDNDILREIKKSHNKV